MLLQADEALREAAPSVLGAPPRAGAGDDAPSFNVAEGLETFNPLHPTALAQSTPSRGAAPKEVEMQALGGVYAL